VLLAFLSHPQRVAVQASLPCLEIPCLLYAGNQDPLDRLLQHRVQRLAQASLVTLHGVTHRQGFFERDLIVPHAKAFLSGVSKAINRRPC